MLEQNVIWFICVLVLPQLNLISIVWPLQAMKFIIKKNMFDAGLLGSFPLTPVRPAQNLGKLLVLAIRTNLSSKSF